MIVVLNIHELIHIFCVKLFQQLILLIIFLSSLIRIFLQVFKKYTEIFSISTKGVLGWELYEKDGINTERLYDFLEKHTVNKYKNKLIIMDNANSHRYQRIKDLVNKEKDMKTKT